MTVRSPRFPTTPRLSFFPGQLTPRQRAILARKFTTRAVQEMIRRPCAAPGCHCRCHELLPTLEVMLATREDDMRNRQTKLGREYDAPDEERLRWPKRRRWGADARRGNDIRWPALSASLRHRQFSGTREAYDNGAANHHGVAVDTRPSLHGLRV